jgi:hypothetical protein
MLFLWNLVRGPDVLVVPKIFTSRPRLRRFVRLVHKYMFSEFKDTPKTNVHDKRSFSLHERNPGGGFHCCLLGACCPVCCPRQQTESDCCCAGTEADGRFKTVSPAASIRQKFEVKAAGRRVRRQPHANIHNTDNEFSL